MAAGVLEACVPDAGAMWLHADCWPLRTLSWSSEAGLLSLILMNQGQDDELHAGSRDLPLT